jgi:hypothetical protein
MTDREKLVEILLEVGKNIMSFPNEGFNEHLADYLISHGVTVKQTSPKDFLAKVKDLERKHYRDIETMHSVLDLAMEELLVELGYEAAVGFIREQERWYA